MSEFGHVGATRRVLNSLSGSRTRPAAAGAVGQSGSGRRRPPAWVDGGLARRLGTQGDHRPARIAAPALPRRACWWANAQAASPAPAAREAPLLARNRDSDGDGACRLLGTVTMARQLTSQMLAETRQTSKRLSRTRRRGYGRRRPAVRSAPAARGTAPTAASGRRAPPARMGRAAIAREPAEGPARADADPVRHRGSCPRGKR